LFCFVYIIWYNVSYLLHLLDCMNLCGAIDGVQFEDPQEQDFEDALSSSSALRKASGS
jgi:hypothetical protein